MDLVINIGEIYRYFVCVEEVVEGVGVQNGKKNAN